MTIYFVSMTIYLGMVFRHGVRNKVLNLVLTPLRPILVFSLFVFICTEQLSLVQDYSKHYAVSNFKTFFFSISESTDFTFLCVLAKLLVIFTP